MENLHSNKATVSIVGVSPGILLHNPTSVGVGAKGIKKQIPTPEDEAERGLYWTEDKKSIAFPARNIHATILHAASGMKVPGNKKMALIPILCGDFHIEPDMVPFNTTDYEIFTCTAVIQRQRIFRSRPNLKTWKLEFTTCWESQFLGKGEDFTEYVLKPLLEIAGSRIGIGDYRPAKRGPFGRFVISGIKLI